MKIDYKIDQKIGPDLSKRRLLHAKYQNLQRHLCRMEKQH